MDYIFFNDETIICTNRNIFYGDDIHMYWDMYFIWDGEPATCTNININNFFIIYETYTNGYITYILDILSLLAILCGIFVIISKNPVVSVLFLIGLFANISCYLIMLGLSFIGLAYLIVYIGAVA